MNENLFLVMDAILIGSLAILGIACLQMSIVDIKNNKGKTRM